MNNYSYYPKSIGEIKSEQTMDCKDWTPKDCLINILRKIDNGADIDSLIICYRQNVDGDIRVRFTQSAKDGLVTVGMLASTVSMIVK